MDQRSIAFGAVVALGPTLWLLARHAMWPDPARAEAAGDHSLTHTFEHERARLPRSGIARR